MASRTCPTYTATIYSGLKQQYEGGEHSLERVKEICRKFAEEEEICLTVTPMQYVYKGGGESGVMVGLLTDPLFPVPDETTRNRALQLGELLRKGLEQLRVSVVCPDMTYSLGEDA